MLPPLSSLTIAGAALAGVLTLIWLAQLAARRVGLARDRPGARLAIIEALALDQRRRLHIIRCDDRAVLMLTGGSQDLVVGWLPANQPPMGQLIAKIAP